MEHTSDIVYDGKLLHDTSYPQRSERYEEMLISAEYNGINLWGQIDYYDSRKGVVHEIKRSDKVEAAHAWQVKFYLWLLRLNGVEDATGLLEYPKLRKIDELFLQDEDCERLKQMVCAIRHLVTDENCPPTINAKICKKCSYYDLCYASEN